MPSTPIPGEKPFSRAWHRRQNRITAHGNKQDELRLLAVVIGLLFGVTATVSALVTLLRGALVAGLTVAGAAVCFLLGARALWRSGRQLPDHEFGEPLTPQWRDSGRALLVACLLVGVGLVLLALSTRAG